MVALLSLAVVDIPLVTTLGYTSALVVLVAVAAAVTLLPAILAIVGDRIDSAARCRTGAARRTTTRTAGSAGRGSSPAARCPSALVATAVLVALALPTLDLYLGQQDNGALPDRAPRRAAPTTASPTAFGVGANGPLLVSVDMSAQPAKPDQAKLDDLDKQEQESRAEGRRQQQQSRLEAHGRAAGSGAARPAQVKPDRSRQTSTSRRSASSSSSKATDPRLHAPARRPRRRRTASSKVTQPLVNSDGTAAVLSVTPTTGAVRPRDRATSCGRLRDDTIPAATERRGHDGQTSAAPPPATSTSPTRSRAS